MPAVILYLVIRLDVQLDFLAREGTDSVGWGGGLVSVLSVCLSGWLSLVAMEERSVLDLHFC